MVLTAVVVLIVLFALFGGKGDKPATTPTATPTMQATAPAVPLPTTDPNAPGVLPGNPVQPPITQNMGAGITVQVLQGAKTKEAAYKDAVARLKELGYTVTKGGKAASAYPQTVIFSVEGHETSATSLNQADPRFATVKPKPASIKAPQNMHVVVGEDWPIVVSGAPAAPGADTPAQPAPGTAVNPAQPGSVPGAPGAPAVAGQPAAPGLPAGQPVPAQQSFAGAHATYKPSPAEGDK